MSNKSKTDDESKYKLAMARLMSDISILAWHIKITNKKVKNTEQTDADNACSVICALQYVISCVAGDFILLCNH